MKEVIRIFKQLQSTNIKKEKETIIEQNKDNELFKKCLRFLLDGNIVTGISAKKIIKQVSNSEYILPTFEDVMLYLKNNNTGTDYDISMMKSFMQENNEDKEFYEQMITKTLRLGCDSKTVNKVIPDLIPTFDIQLGTSFDKCKLNEGTWISLSRKLNGVRCSWVGNKFLSRQNKEYIGLNHIKEDLLLLDFENTFVDGELLYKNEEGLSDSEAFQMGTGIAMSKNGDKSQLKFVIFDMIPLDEFWNKQSQETYKTRRQKLEELRHVIQDRGIQNLDVVEMVYEGTDHNKIWEWLDYAEAHDWEGCMVNLDTPYECKRTKNLMKVKSFKEIDLRCVDINLATSGKYKGGLGSIRCKYKDGYVDVGSGLDEQQREYYFNNPDEIVGRICSIKFKEITRNKDGGESLQFPVLVAVRNPADKDFADDEH